MYTRLSKLTLFGTATALAALITVTGCKKDKDPAGNMKVSTVKAGAVDLNTATAATGVAVGDNIVITFDKAVSTTTATSANVMLTPDGGTATATNVTATGSTITVDPSANLDPGTDYTLSLGAGLKAADGGAFTARSIPFKTAGNAPVRIQQTAMKAFWDFRNRITDSLGTGTGVTQIGIAYGADRFGNANGAALFNGTTTIVEVPNAAGLITPSITNSFWVKIDSATGGHGHFPMGMNFFFGYEFEINRVGDFMKHGGGFAKSNSTSPDSLTYPDLGVRTNGMLDTANPEFVFAKNYGGGPALKALMSGKWAQITYTYNAASKLRTLYINGEKAVQANYNSAKPSRDLRRITGSMPKTVGAPGELSSTFAFGFAKGRDASFWEDPSTEFGQYSSPNANHLKGMLDDVRFWNVALTDAEVTQLYNIEKP